jgi:hypothetical protein
MSPVKERRVVDGNRMFESKWSEKELFMCIKSTVVLVGCN